MRKILQSGRIGNRKASPFNSKSHRQITDRFVELRDKFNEGKNGLVSKVCQFDKICDLVTQESCDFLP